jgi:hypothetical protein
VFGSGPVQQIELTLTGRSLFASVCASTGFHDRMEQDKELNVGVGFYKNLSNIRMTGEARYSLVTVGPVVHGSITCSRRYHLSETATITPFVKLECFAPISHSPTRGILGTTGCVSHIKLPRDFFFTSRIAVVKDSGAVNFRPGVLLVGTTALGRSFSHERSACVLLIFSVPIAGADHDHLPAGHGPHHEERHPHIAVGMRFSWKYNQ